MEDGPAQSRGTVPYLRLHAEASARAGTGYFRSAGTGKADAVPN